MAAGSAADWPYQKLADSAAPSETDLEKTVLLDKWIEQNAEIEDKAERQKRERIIAEMTATVRAWVS